MSKKTFRNVRLTDDILPKKYKIHLEPDLDEFVFVGEEEIILELKKPTNQITLHAAELEISSAVLFQNKKEIVGKVSFSEKDETVTFKFSSQIKPGQAILKLKFTGILNDKMRGFYRSNYELAGKNYHMAVTQFESTDARRAFPCFDEPSKKAVFEVSLKIPKDRTLISNTIESEVLEHAGGLKTVKFLPTPLMSSYLLAFIVGHFKHIEKKTNSNVLVRVFTTPDKIHQAKFALATAVACIEFYENYFGIKYPLPTIDLIAVADFAAGAMENWGAVTYRESAILVDENLTSSANKQWVALVIAHELAHQWFGNLVTMEWWTDLWLNEGFASYMEYLAVDSLYPEWNIWSQFVLLDHARALELDGLVNTHPIEVPVNHPSEIAEIFDAVSYSKGASVIRMLAEFLGKKDFQAGLQIYLKRHKYSNAKTTDLWKALESSSGKKVEKIMETWTGTAGYPLVSLTSKNKNLKITQGRFFSNPKSKKDSKSKTVWPIPMNILTPTSKKPSFFLFDKKSQKLSSTFEKSAFIKLNARETSFVRVDYGEYLEKLEVPLSARNKSLRPSDRFGIVRDAFALAEAGISGSESALKLALSYTHEESYNIWAQIAGDISKIANLLYGQKEYGHYNNYALRVFSHICRHLGWKKKKTESHSHSLLRPIVLYAMGKYQDAATIDYAKKLFKEEQAGKEKIPSDVRGVVFNLVAENGGEREYEILLNLFHHEKLEEERDRLLRALCQFQDKKLLLETLSMAFGHNMHGQDAVKAVNFVLINRFGRDVAWEYIKKNWDEIEKRFGGGHLFTRFVEPLDMFVTHEKAAEIKKFFAEKNTEGLERTINQVIEQIESNADWLARDHARLASFLSQFT